MTKEKALLNPIEAAELIVPDLIQKDGEGKILNRSTAYDVVKRLPADLKVRLGSSLYVIRPKLEAWMNGEKAA